jgi:Iap family predicted aminopeptidase
MRDQLKGAIVMTQPILTNFVRKDRPQPTDPGYEPNSAAYATSVGARPSTGSGQAPSTGSGQAPATPETPQQRNQRVTEALKAAGAGVILKPSTGEHGTVFVTGRDGGPGAVPTVTLSAEHYNMIARMLARNIPVKLRVNVQSTFYDNDGGNAYNVIAELPGTDPALRDEVVMLGAHLDSWHTGVGATDNADGTATMMEALRILKAIGVHPRRTIRVALWGGEEQGLLGSKAWVDQHLAGDANRAAREKFDVYFNIDNGTGPIYGFYLQESKSVQPLFDAWLAPLKDLGARKNTLEPIGSTDHLSFVNAGVPGFNPIQDYVNYDIRTHHTNMDTVERLQVKDIQQAAIVMATFAYQCAMADERIPRPPAKP